MAWQAPATARQEQPQPRRLANLLLALVLAYILEASLAARLTGLSPGIAHVHAGDRQSDCDLHLFVHVNWHEAKSRKACEHTHTRQWTKRYYQQDTGDDLGSTRPSGA